MVIFHNILVFKLYFDKSKLGKQMFLYNSIQIIKSQFQITNGHQTLTMVYM